jgi:hypothetical protein
MPTANETAQLGICTSCGFVYDEVEMRDALNARRARDS